MTRDLVPWVFVLLLLGSEMILSVVHAQSMAECRTALAGEAGTAATVKQGAVHEHATAQPERPNLGLIIAASLSVAVVSALWIVGVL